MVHAPLLQPPTPRTRCALNTLSAVHFSRCQKSSGTATKRTRDRCRRCHSSCRCWCWAAALNDQTLFACSLFQFTEGFTTHAKQNPNQKGLGVGYPAFFSSLLRSLLPLCKTKNILCPVIWSVLCAPPPFCLFVYMPMLQSWMVHPLSLLLFLPFMFASFCFVVLFSLLFFKEKNEFLLPQLSSFFSYASLLIYFFTVFPHL